MSGHTMSFVATASLRRDAETFISNIQRGEKSPQNALLQRVLDAFIAQCLDTYFVRPAELVGLNPVGRKIVVTAVATIRKTVQMVVGRIVRKLSNREMQPLADYIDSVMLRDRRNHSSLALIAFPLDEPVVEQFFAMQRQAHAPDADRNSNASLVTPFQTIASEAITYYFQEPVEMLRLGPVLRKMSQLGVDTTRSVVSGVIARIFSTMTPQQVAATLDYFCGLISEGAPDLAPVADMLELASRA